MNKTSVYQFSFQYAYAHDECAQYNASLSANTACKEAIETAIGKHYADYRLDSDAAVREVVREFGYDRTVFVLASSIRRMDTDGRISQKNKEWARTIPIPETDERQIYYMVTRSHPGLLDIFTNTARHEYLLSLPLKRADIKAEASRILGQLREAAEPNSPSGTHFMARVSPDFWARAKQKDHDRLMGMLPFASLSLSTLDGYKGVYALITRDEDRSRPLILRKPSVRKKLQEASPPPGASGPSKGREQER